jgi:hypothetical protein
MSSSKKFDAARQKEFGGGAGGGGGEGGGGGGGGEKMSAVQKGGLQWEGKGAEGDAQALCFAAVVKQSQSEAAGWTKDPQYQGRVQHCAHTVLILYSYCAHTVLILC